MFTNFSWANYLLVITLILTVYYLFVGVRFYLQEVQQFFSALRRPTTRPALNQLPDDSGNQQVEHDFVELQSEEVVLTDSFTHCDEPTIQELEILTNQIQVAFSEASSELFGKEALVQLLRQILKMYPNLAKSPFQLTIQEFIISESERNGTIHLNKEEIQELWKEVYR